MPYNEGLANRIRAVLAEHTTIAEKKMFGGLTFMLDGHMCCGIANDDLVVRVGKDQNEEALAQPHTRPMDFTGRPMDGYVYISAAGYQSDADLADWISRGIRFVKTLPPK